MIRLPCERYIWLMLLDGLPNRAILQRLRKLGYRSGVVAFLPGVENASAQPILEYISEYRSMVSSLRLEDDGYPSDEVLAELGLYSVVTDRGTRADLGYLVNYSSIRETVDILLSGGHTPEEVARHVYDRKKLTLSVSALAVYRSLILDFSELTLGDREYFRNIHTGGREIFEAHAAGKRGALLLAGFPPGFEASEDLFSSCGAAMERLQQALRLGDPGTASIYSNVLRGLYDLLGPAVSFQELLRVLRETRIAAVPLQSLRVQPGLDISGRLLPKVVYADVQGVTSRVQKTFNEYTRAAMATALLEAAKPIQGEPPK